MSGGRRFSLRKQMTLIEYIVGSHPQGITRTKLRHILYLIDLESYHRMGKSMTGALYRKGKSGVIVQGLTRALRTLRAEGRIS